jgi:hypothetical protein
MLLRYSLNDFVMVSFAYPIIGITFVFTFHMLYISTVRPLYFRIFFSWTLSISHLCVPKLQHLLAYMCLFWLSQIMISGLLLGMVVVVVVVVVMFMFKIYVT